MFSTFIISNKYKGAKYKMFMMDTLQAKPGGGGGGRQTLDKFSHLVDIPAI